MASDQSAFPPVTAVLVSWNGRKWLERFLPPLLATDWPDLRVIVVDNASTDGSPDWLAQHFPQVRLVRHHVNAGFAEGNNLALPYIETPYFALVNTDVEVTADWLAPLVQALVEDAALAAVQPKIRAHAQPSHFEYAGASGGFIDQWGYAFCRGRLFDAVEEDQGQYDDPAPVFWTSGACMLLRTEAVERLGLFEPSFFAHWEEIDWCWRAQNYGYGLRVVPQSVVYHVGGGTLAADSPRKLRLNLRNSLLTYARNAPALEALRLALARLVLDGVFALRDLLRGRWRTVGAVAQAHLGFYAGLPQALAHRRGRPKRSFMSLDGVWSGSVVWAFFAKRIKAFAGLPGLSK